MGTLEEAAFLARTGEQRKNTREREATWRDCEIAHRAVLFVRKRRAVSTSSHQLMEGRDKGNEVGTSFTAALSNPLVPAPRLLAGSPGHRHPPPPQQAQVNPTPTRRPASQQCGYKEQAQTEADLGRGTCGPFWPSTLSCLMDLTWSHPPCGWARARCAQQYRGENSMNTSQTPAALPAV